MIFLFSGPSGVGKSTIIAAIRQKRDFQFSVSYTSRNIREGEYNGEDYNFVTEEEFLEFNKLNSNYEKRINTKDATGKPEEFQLTLITNVNINYGDKTDKALFKESFKMKNSSETFELKK